MIHNRISVVEYQPSIDFLASASKLSGVDTETIRRAVRIQGERIRSLLGGNTVPIRLEDDVFVAEDVAGLVRLLPGLEVEIAPKFLGLTWPSWREDFLVVANLARSGQLLIHEGISASTGARDDLTSLVARTFVDLFERSRRRPLRTYRSASTFEWSLDGEIEAEDVLMPGENGYQLRSLLFSAQNRYNAQISSAARLMAPDVRDGVLQRQVRRVAQRLGPQEPPSPRPATRVPARHRSWQDCYELANQINAGFGVRLAPGKLLAPGYVLTTWLAFEQLLLTAMRIGVQPAQVTYHARFDLGKRLGGDTVVVQPDIFVRTPNGAHVLFDAKYKGRAQQSPSISPADLYEALAFSEASGINRVTLIYPRPADHVAAQETGTVEKFEEITVSGRTVVGVVLECRGLSARGGLTSLAKGVASLI